MAISTERQNPNGAMARPHNGELRQQLIELRRHLHMYPEIGFEEIETSRHVREWLTERDFQVHGPLAGTGFYVEIEGALPGPTLGYRSELDALPSQDQKEADYVSRNPGVAHLCGHDAHMSVACGVAMLLRERREELHGTVRVFFQPNEEGSPTGAPFMIADGILGDMEAVYAIHVDPTLPIGQFGLKEGAITAACAPFMVTIDSGETGHSARPHEVVDTVWLATQILNSLYQLLGRIHDARRTAVITVCQFRAGEALNVIPDHVRFAGTLRCIDRDAMRELQRRMRRLVEAEGALNEADVQVEFKDVLPPVINDGACIDHAREAIRALRGDDAVRELRESSMGGEDFSYYLERIPGAMIRVGTAEDIATRFPLHHAKFDIAEAALPLAVNVMTETLLRHGAGTSTT